MTAGDRKAKRPSGAARSSRKAAAAAAGALAGSVAPRLNEAESPLAWLRRRLDRNGEPMIGAEQFAAGERLRADLWRARMTPRVTASWSGIPQSRQRRGAPGAGVDPGEAMMAAQERVRRALRAVGPEFIDLLMDVCGQLRGLEEIERDRDLPQRSAKRFLQMALTALARHYGMLPPVDIDYKIEARLRHWGSNDFRPAILEP